MDSGTLADRLGDVLAGYFIGRGIWGLTSMPLSIYNFVEGHMRLDQVLLTSCFLLFSLVIGICLFLKDKVSLGIPVALMATATLVTIFDMLHESLHLGVSANNIPLLLTMALGIIVDLIICALLLWIWLLETRRAQEGHTQAER